MATTTNYGWTTPDDTALVKDGAAAIRTLGSSIDTSLNTALGTKKAGLVLLNTTSFSGVASQSINDVFNTNYDSYRIIIDAYGTISSANVLQFRIRVGGSDLTTNFYTTNTKYNYAGSSTTFDVGGGSAAVSFIELSYLPANATDGRCSINVDIHNPFTANVTTLNGTANGTRSGVALAGAYITGQVVNNTSYTGFTVYPSAGGTITGRLSVYGYNK